MKFRLLSLAAGCVKASLDVQQAEKALRWAMIDAALAECRGNQCLAARRLGVHRNTLARDIAEMRRAGRAVNTTTKRGGSAPGWHYYRNDRRPPSTASVTGTLIETPALLRNVGEARMPA